MGPGGSLTGITNRVLETSLEAEMSDHKRRVEGVDSMVISLTAKGLATEVTPRAARQRVRHRRVDMR